MTSPQPRLAYIDWMRGFACVVMIETHCYNSWLSADAKKSEFYRYSQMGGTLPAPLFIFLAGISVALVTEKLRARGIDRNAIAAHVMRRGAEILGLGLLFRLQEFILGIPLSPWTDLLRVDILNILGISMILMGALCWLAGSGAPSTTRARTLVSALAVAAVIAMLTPPLWNAWRPRFLPWPLESYVNGVHIFNHPQVWLFPIFPWAAFALVGLAVGFWLSTNFEKTSERRSFVWLGISAVVMFSGALALDHWGPKMYAVYDYWHSSPNFFLARSAVIILLLCASYIWSRWGFAHTGFSPVEQLGKTSLLVYWVHIEFVYGRLSILPKGRCSITVATLGMCLIFAAMLGISLATTNWRRKRAPHRLATA
jgi:uncharacterized membrane protein